MKRFWTKIAMLMLWQSYSYAQTDSLVIAQLTILQPNDLPAAHQKVQLRGKRGFHAEYTTNAQGVVEAQIPMQDEYAILCNKKPCTSILEVENQPNVIYRVQTFTERHLICAFEYTNFQNQPLPNEEVTVTSRLTGKVYRDTTDANGKAELILPYAGDYSVSVKYLPNFQTIQAPSGNFERFTARVQLTSEGSIEKERIARLIDSIGRVSLEQAQREAATLDSMRLVDMVLRDDRTIFVRKKDKRFLSDCAMRKAERYSKEIQKNPKFFEERRKPVLASLWRMRDQWKHKIVVTDITGSMYPYIEEVLIWHALNFVERQTDHYIFFNDGNQATKKPIGAAGGLYSCDPHKMSFEHVVEVMQQGILNGDGGDTPENDLEAVLAAQHKRKHHEEIVLIADNFSAVRDFALLEKVNVPIRVILCGLEDKPSKNEEFRRYANEQYLQIAYKSGGSVHTIREDIWDLSSKKDGDTVFINGVPYILRNGQFRRKN